MRKPYPIVLLTALFIATCGTAAGQQRDTATASATSFPAPAAHQDAQLTARITDSPNGTFGYEVYSDGKLLVQQQNVPGRSGWNGCPQRAQAEKLSALVIDKIRHGLMPPTVTEDELKALGL